MNVDLTSPTLFPSRFFQLFQLFSNSSLPTLCQLFSPTFFPKSLSKSFSNSFFNSFFPTRFQTRFPTHVSNSFPIFKLFPIPFQLFPIPFSTLFHHLFHLVCNSFSNTSHSFNILFPTPFPNIFNSFYNFFPTPFPNISNFFFQLFFQFFIFLNFSNSVFPTSLFPTLFSNSFFDSFPILFSNSFPIIFKLVSNLFLSTFPICVPTCFPFFKMFFRFSNVYKLFQLLLPSLFSNVFKLFPIFHIFCQTFFPTSFPTNSCSFICSPCMNFDVTFPHCSNFSHLPHHLFFHVFHEKVLRFTSFVQLLSKFDCFLTVFQT